MESSRCSSCSLPSIVKRLLMLDVKDWAVLIFPIEFPTGAKAGQARAALRPAYPRGVRELGHALASGAKSKIAPKIVNPAKKDGPRPVDLRTATGPNGG